MMEKDMKSGRLNGIQSLRALAFLAIFLSHCKVTPTGSVGASCFLILSGFCMSYSYLPRQKDPGCDLKSRVKFTAAKIGKLYPLHVVTMLAVALLVWGAGMHEGGLLRDALSLPLNLLLVQSWIPDSHVYFSYNAVSWYLSVVVFLYFMFPVILRYMRKHERNPLLFLAAAELMLGMGAELIFRDRALVKWFTYIFPAFRILDFMIGCFAGKAFLEHREGTKKMGFSRATAAEAAAGLMLLGALLLSGAVKIPMGISFSFYWMPFCLAAIFLTAMEQGAISGFLSRNRLLLWIGDRSACAFLIHQMVIKFTGFIFKNKLLMTVVSLALTMLACVVWMALQKCAISAMSRKKEEKTAVK